MIFLKDGQDLRQILGSRILFSREPVFIRIPELDPTILVGHELSINALKTTSCWSVSVKAALVVLALLTGWYLHTNSFSPAGLALKAPWFLLATLATVLVGRLAARQWIKIRLKREIKAILRQMDALEKVYGQQWTLE